MRMLALALSALSLLPGAALAQAAAALPADTAAVAAPPADEVQICREESSGGNSRLGMRKVCHTQKE